MFSGFETHRIPTQTQHEIFRDRRAEVDVSSVALGAYRIEFVRRAGTVFPLKGPYPPL